MRILKDNRMIRVHLPNKTLGIGFIHPSKAIATDKNLPFFLTRMRFTHCEIFEIVPNAMMREGFDVRLLSEGVTMCSPRDNFVKEAGRKIALTRALGKLKLGKKERTLVWEAYMARKTGTLEQATEVMT